MTIYEEKGVFDDSNDVRTYFSVRVIFENSFIAYIMDGVHPVNPVNPVSCKLIALITHERLIKA
jgi:hypothetical protein